MFKTQAETRAYFAALAPLVAASTHCDIIVAPPFTALAAAGRCRQGHRHFDFRAKHVLGIRRRLHRRNFSRACWSKQVAAR